MKISNSIKVFSLGVLAAGLLSTSFAANRVGPVSQYGQLQAGKIPLTRDKFTALVRALPMEPKSR